MAAEDEDRWHVMVAPGEVKLLTLEQLDDLFRLEIIDESTSVRGPGMSGWLPLGVAAGIEPEAKPTAVALAPAPSAPVRSRPPPPISPGRSSAPPPPKLAPAFAPQVAPPPPPTVATFAPPAPAQAFLFAPPPVAQLVVPESLRPMASESSLSAPASRGGGGWLIALAVLLGAGTTVYRNGLVRDLARSSGQEAIYGRLEAAVGGPSFGTPRAVEQLDVAASPVKAETTPAVAAKSAEAPAKTAKLPAAKNESAKTAERTSARAVRLEDLPPAPAAAGSRALDPHP